MIEWLAPIGGGGVVIGMAGLFVRSMLKQDFGAWKLVAHQDKVIADQAAEITRLNAAYIELTGRFVELTERSARLEGELEAVRDELHRPRGS